MAETRENLTRTARKRGADLRAAPRPTGRAGGGPGAEAGGEKGPPGRVSRAPEYAHRAYVAARSPPDGAEGHPTTRAAMDRGRRRGWVGGITPGTPGRTPPSQIDTVVLISRENAGAKTGRRRRNPFAGRRDGLYRATALQATRTP